MVLAEPIDTMDKDRLWACPGRDSVKEPPPEGHCTAADRGLVVVDGMLRDKADLLWPRPLLAGGGDAMVLLPLLLRFPPRGDARLESSR